MLHGRFAVAVAAALAALGPVSVAEAQQTIGITRAQVPSTASTAQRGRPPVDPPIEDDMAGDVAPAVPRDDPTRDPDEIDILDNQRPGAGHRAVVRDGDLSYPPEPAAPRDGIVDGREPEPVRDGVDPLAVDTRTREDYDAFENPPAGYDPLLFQIEDVDPLADRRIARLARAEPYDPIGIRIGSFVLFPEIEIGGSSYTNVLRSPSADRDVALDARPSGRLVSDWRRHALELRASSVLSFYNRFDSEDDRAYTLEARGRVDITRRTNVQAFATHDVAQESRSAIDANAAGDRATVTTDAIGASFQHRFNRLTVQLRGSVTEYDYSDVDVGGVTQSNADRNYTAYEQAVRATWEFKPTLSAFTEIATNERRFDAPAVSDGISRDSDGERYRVGLAFGSTGQILRGEASIGYGRQRPLDGRLAEVDGLLVDASVSWRMSELTTLLLTARSDIAETTTADSGGVFTRVAGIEVRHSFRRDLIATAGITYTDQDYASVPIQENEWRADLGVEQHISREAMVFGRYRHTAFSSTSPGSSYDADELHVGLRFRR
ncbi:MAG: outer membrane beta-barrel protein [Hyphomicrobiaceae bacterium]|nr:outer membrane beta-barrel protein [Hyphomicrobiaceae bacterium]